MEIKKIIRHVNGCFWGGNTMPDCKRVINVKKMGKYCFVNGFDYHKKTDTYIMRYSGLTTIDYVKRLVKTIKWNKSIIVKGL